MWTGTVPLRTSRRTRGGTRCAGTWLRTGLCLILFGGVGCGRVGGLSGCVGCFVSLGFFGDGVGDGVGVLASCLGGSAIVILLLGFP